MNAAGPRWCKRVRNRKSALEMVRFLVANGAEINAQDNSGETALIKAVRIGALEVIRLLVENGADINAQDSSGKTVLIQAARQGDWEVVHLLVENGADINAQDSSGEHSLDESYAGGCFGGASLFSSKRCQYKCPN